MEDVIKGIWIPVEGKVKRVEIHKGDTLKALQRYVGGNIEGVPLKDGNEMYVNDSGMIDGLEFNRRATIFARSNFAYAQEDLMPGWPGVVLHGDAIVVAVDPETGDTISTTLDYGADNL